MRTTFRLLMFSSFGCQLLAAPGHGVWGVGCKPLSSLEGATIGGHVLVFQEQPKQPSIDKTA